MLDPDEQMQAEIASSVQRLQPGFPEIKVGRDGIGSACVSDFGYDFRDLRPLLSVAGGSAPSGGSSRSSDNGTCRVTASLSKRSIVGFSVCRSKPPK